MNFDNDKKRKLHFNSLYFVNYQHFTHIISIVNETPYITKQLFDLKLVVIKVKQKTEFINAIIKVKSLPNIILNKYDGFLKWKNEILRYIITTQ